MQGVQNFIILTCFKLNKVLSDSVDTNAYSLVVRRLVLQCSSCMPGIGDRGWFPGRSLKERFYRAQQTRYQHLFVIRTE